MAPMGKSGKRVAKSPELPSKRQKSKGKKTDVDEVDPVTEKCNLVAEVLGLAEQWPESVRCMFAKIVPDTLGLLKEERHEYQEDAVSKIGAALAGVEAAIQKRMGDSETKVNNADNEKVRRDEAVVGSEAALAAKKAEVVARYAEMDTEDGKLGAEQTRSAMEATKDALHDAEKAQQVGDASLEVAASDHSEFEAVMKDIYAPLKDGIEDARKYKPTLSKLLKFGAKYELDPSLVDSLPTPLGKEPQARGPFDGIILKQFEEWYSQRVAEYVATVRDGAEDKAQRATVVEAARATHTEAEDLWMEATGQKAREELKGCEKALKASQKAAKSFLSDIEEARDEHESAKAQLEAFRESELAAFNDLKDRSGLKDCTGSGTEAEAVAEAAPATPCPQDEAPPSAEATGAE